MFDWFRRKDHTERRSVDTQGFTALAMLARANAITDAGADLSGTVAGCVSLWSNGLAQADTDGDILTPEILASIGRQLAIEGNSVWYAGPAGLVPVSDYSLDTIDGRARAYRLSIPEVGGARSVVALAGEVLHVKIGTDARRPWEGIPPLRRAQISAALLQATESALADTFADAPIGSKVLGMPEGVPGANTALAASFKGKHGRVLVRDSAAAYAGQQGTGDDWRPADLTPNLRDSMAVESLQRAREAILYSFGVLPVLMSSDATDPVIREAQRHLAQWTLAPIARLIKAEVQRVTGQTIKLDVSAGLHAFDIGGRTRAMGAIIEALARAKEGGVTPEQVADAARIAGVPE